MRKLISYIPDTFDILYQPRIGMEPLYFTHHYARTLFDVKSMRIGPFMFFAEYEKG